MKRIKQLWSVYGPETKGGKFRLFGWPAEFANGKSMVVHIRQIVGTKRWSIALVHVDKEVGED